MNVSRLCLGLYSSGASLKAWVSALRLSDIPEKEFFFRTSRSSGPGGQHVNTTNTKVDGRILIKEALWIPEKLRENLISQVFPTH
ncbi:hypothetical protein MDAP_000654 [Mitosporidium daphniae]